MIRKGKDSFKELNDFFCYGISGDTLHLHVVPKDIKGTIAQLGGQNTIAYIGEMLFDALQKAIEISKQNEKVKKVFAISPDFKIEKVRELFEMMGFKSEIATAKMFYEMFKNEKELYQVSIPIEALGKIVEKEKALRESMDLYSPNQSIGSDYLRVQMMEKCKLVKEQIGDNDGMLFEKLIKNAVAGFSFRSQHPHGIKTRSERSNDEFDR